MFRLFNKRQLPLFCFSGCSHICTHQNKCACDSWGHPSREWDWRQTCAPGVRREHCVYRGSSQPRTQWSAARTETSRWQLVPAAPQRRGWCSKCGAWFSSAGSAQGPASCISQTRTCLTRLALPDQSLFDQWHLWTQIKHNEVIYKEDRQIVTWAISPQNNNYGHNP